MFHRGVEYGTGRTFPQKQGMKYKGVCLGAPRTKVKGFRINTKGGGATEPGILKRFTRPAALRVRRRRIPEGDPGGRP